MNLIRPQRATAHGEASLSLCICISSLSFSICLHIRVRVYIFRVFSVCCIASRQFLSAEALVLLLKGQEVFGTGLARLATKDQLGSELPVGRDTPLGGDALVDQWVVVLEVGAQTLGLESGPDGELQHGVRVGGPGGEAVGVDGELLLHLVDDLLVFVEEDLHGKELRPRELAIELLSTGISKHEERGGGEEENVQFQHHP